MFNGCREGGVRLIVPALFPWRMPWLLGLMIIFQESPSLIWPSSGVCLLLLVFFWLQFLVHFRTGRFESHFDKMNKELSFLNDWLQFNFLKMISFLKKKQAFIQKDCFQFFLDVNLHWEEDDLSLFCSQLELFLVFCWFQMEKLLENWWGTNIMTR